MLTEGHVRNEKHIFLLTSSLADELYFFCVCVCVKEVVHSDCEEVRGVMETR